MASSHQTFNSALLSLPLETRLQIYTLLAHQSQSLPHTHASISPTFTLPHTAAAPFCALHASQPRQWKAYRPSNSPKQILCTLNTVNRQIYHEIRGLGFITFPELAMEVFVDFEANDKGSMVQVINEALGQETLREMVVAVGIYYLCCSVSCRHRKKEHMSVSDSFRSMLLPAPTAIPNPKFRAMVESVEKFRSLRFIHVSFNHGDMLEWFENDAKRTLDVFEPFLRNGGKVSIGSQCVLDSVGQSCEPCDRLAGMLRKGKGSIVMEGNSKLKRELVLRTK